MIIATKADKHDEGWRIVLYDQEAHGTGSAAPTLTHAEFHEEIDTYYQQRQLERERLYAELIEGKTSPVGFFLMLQGMDVKDVAKRMKLRPGVVRRHLTPEGFASATVEQLRRYARIFDVSVADFFWFARCSDGVSVEVRSDASGLLQLVDLSPTGQGSAGERS
ncbi:MAG: hypothetical protein MUC50_09025 [Myxococcota bacterium]|jgi:hypothetical protein|nr:hypothetical protein [Myxococcota bacterium]